MILKKIKRILAFTLTLAMLLSLVPAVFATDTYEKATSIAVGDTVLLVCEGKGMELSAISTTSTKYGIGVAYTGAPNGVAPLEVVAGASDGTYAFKLGDAYLYWTSGNSLATNATLSANTSWNVSFDSNGNVIITNGKDSSRKLQWNAGSPRFACYTSSQTAIQLYKLATAGEEPTEPECAHENANSEVTTKATCTADGILTYTCECGETWEEVIPATGHSFDDGVETVAPGCETDGLLAKTCANCGDTVEEPIPAPGHSYVDGICENCSEEEPEVDSYQLITLDTVKEGEYIIGAVRSETYPTFYPATTKISSGDLYVSGTAVTATDDTITGDLLPTDAQIFTLAGDNVNGFTIGYNDGGVMKYLGYTSASSRKLAFDEKYVSTLWTIVADPDGGFALSGKSDLGIYTVSQNSTALGAIRGYGSTTIYTGIYLFAKVENEPEVPTEPEVCEHPNMIIDEKAPTCIEGGYKTWVCPDCEESGEETYARDPEAHQPGRTVTLILDDANCTYPGSNQVIVYCDLCNAETSNTIVEIPVNGIHNIVDGYCTVCGRPAGGEVLTLAAELCDGDRVVLYSVAGNCVVSLNASGSKLAPATDFTLDGDTLVTGPDTAVFTACDMGNDQFVFETYDFRVLTTGEKGNSLYFGEWGDPCELWYLVPVEGQPGIFKIMNVNAAYNNVANQALEYYRDTFTTYGVAETEAYYFRLYTIAAPGACDHEMTLVEVLEEPTCSTPGLGIYKCDICGEEVEEELETVDHAWDEGVFTAPGCTAVGYTAYTCTVCGQEHYEYTPATGHSYAVAVTQAPTCTEAGYITYLCSGCNHSYNETADPALGHIWTEATCTSASYCERCNEPGAVFVAMESAEELSDATQIVIVANVDGVYKALGTTIAATMDAVDVTVANGVVTGEDLPVWTARLTTESGYALTAGGDYLMHKNSTSFGSTPEAFSWTFENTENGIKIYNGNRAIVYRTSSVNAFRAYATSNIGANSYYGELLIFKYELGTTLDHVDNDGDNCCDSCGIPLVEEGIDVALLSRSITLNGNIGVNFYMSLSDKVLADENAYMLFTQEGKEPVKVSVADGIARKVKGNTAYVFTYEVAAKEMTDIITAQFFYGDTCTEEYTYSVKTYADNQRTNLSENESLMNLLDAMLRYGAAAQLQFNYNIDRPADEGMEPVDYTDLQIDGYPTVLPQGTELVTFAGATLLLRSETTLRFFLSADDSVEDFTVTYNGQPLKITLRNGLYYVDVENIAAPDLDMEYTITVNDGTATADITYSPLSYCASVKANASGLHDEVLMNVVAALYLYNRAANNYFTPAE